MTTEIILTLAILGIAILLFISEKLRPDLIALVVLVALVLTGLVTPVQGLSGFSNTAVIVVWAMFILSAGLTRTGVATAIGNQVMRFAGRGQARLTGVLMVAAGLISGYGGMNNIGVTALLLPVVIEIARRTRMAASKLLMPLLFASLLGGMSLLIGTPVNLLVNEVISASEYQPLNMFSFTPVATVFLIGAILYMVLIGRRTLPEHKTRRLFTSAGMAGMAALEANHIQLYGLEERLAYFDLPPDSWLAGKTLAESRIGTALGLNILSIKRGEHMLPPYPSQMLEGGDRLLVLGRLDHLQEMSSTPPFIVVEDTVTLTQILSTKIGLAEFRVTKNSQFNGSSLVELGMRQKFGVNVLAIERDGKIRRTNLQNLALQAGDKLVLQGRIDRLEELRDQPEFHRLNKEDARRYALEDRLLYLRLPESSPLTGKTLAEARLGAAYGLVVLDIIRSGQDWLMPSPETFLQAGDLLIVEGRPMDTEVVRGLQSIEVQTEAAVDLEELETGPMSFVEVVLSPYSRLAGKTLKKLNFREKFGLSVLAIWRGERSYRTDLGVMELRYGDALLCYGPRERFAILAREADYIVLEPGLQEPPRRKRAPLAVAILAGVVLSVFFNLLSITIAALLGVVLMVLTGCLTMDEAYNAIEWKAVFLIAGMLPLGIAMQETGTAAFLADLVLGLVGGFGPYGVLAGIFLLTMLATQFMPNPVVAVLIAPIALTTAANMGIQPYAFVLAVAYAASSSFLTPVAHPANVLVVTPGGYTFGDFLKNGIPVAIIVFLTSLLLLPLLYPF